MPERRCNAQPSYGQGPANPIYKGMYQSLYDILAPLIRSKANGRLTIYHGIDEKAELVFQQGKILKIQTDGRTGVEAAKIMVKWVSLAYQFVPQEVMLEGNGDRMESVPWLKFFQQLEAPLAKFRNLLGGNSAVIQFVAAGDGELTFSAPELKISFALDGEKTVQDIVLTTDQSEFDTLATICRFMQKGWAQPVRPHAPLSSEGKQSLFRFLITVLDGICGPGAEVRIADALEAMHFAPEQFSQCDILLLLRLIAVNLSSEEQERFYEQFKHFSHPDSK
jgi:hypothetical protein